ncbi:MAG: hypothetical protein GC190_21195 [Alphaproteobacteria bacterium]|nr:hypothetical protein [Alphaproteobacteria bacterium]
MAKSAVTDDARADGDAAQTAPLLAPGATGAAASVLQSSGTQAAPAPAGGEAAPQSGDSDAPAAGMTSVPQTGAQVMATPAPAPENPANPAPLGKDQLERAKALAKLKILDWVRQQMRDDPAGLALRMPYMQTRLKAWEDAKASGDAGRMTKTYNDLLRGLEAEQNRRGIPKDEQRVLPNDMAEDVARGILNAEPAKMLDKLRAAKADHGDYADGLMQQIGHFMPEALKVADGQSSKLMGELLWRRTASTTAGSELLPDFLNHPQDPRSGDLSTLDLYRRTIVGSDANLPDLFQTPFESAVPSRSAALGSVAAAPPRGNEKTETAGFGLFDGPPPPQPRPRRTSGVLDRGDPRTLDWSAPAAMSRLARMRDEPLTILTLLHLAYEAYQRGDDRRSPPQLMFEAAGWEVLPIPAEEHQSGYYAFAVYNPIAKTVIIINRGTDSIHDAAVTGRMKAGFVSNQMDDAANFLYSVQAKIREMQRNGREIRNCLTIGHSLGGSLAEYQMMISRNDPSFRSVPKFSAVTFAAARVRPALEEGLRMRLANFPLMPTDSLRDYAIDFTMKGDGIALGHFLGDDGSLDDRYSERDLVGRAQLLDWVDQPSILWWRKYAKNHPGDPEASVALGELDWLNHSLSNYYGPPGVLQSKVGQWVVGYDGSKRIR